MRELIEAHDIVVNQNTDIRLVTVRETPKKTVYAHWVDWDGHLIDRKVLEILIDLIERCIPGICNPPVNILPDGSFVHVTVIFFAGICSSGFANFSLIFYLNWKEAGYERL